MKRLLTGSVVLGAAPALVGCEPASVRQAKEQVDQNAKLSEQNVDARAKSDKHQIESQAAAQKTAIEQNADSGKTAAHDAAIAAQQRADTLQAQADEAKKVERAAKSNDAATP